MKIDRLSFIAILSKSLPVGSQLQSYLSRDLYEKREFSCLRNCSNVGRGSETQKFGINRVKGQISTVKKITKMTLNLLQSFSLRSDEGITYETSASLGSLSKHDVDRSENVV